MGQVVVCPDVGGMFSSTSYEWLRPPSLLRVTPLASLEDMVCSVLALSEYLLSAGMVSLLPHACYAHHHFHMTLLMWIFVNLCAHIVLHDFLGGGIHQALLSTNYVQAGVRPQPPKIVMVGRGLACGGGLQDKTGEMGSWPGKDAGRRAALGKRGWIMHILETTRN